MKKLATLLIPIIFYFGCAKEPMKIDNIDNNSVLDLLVDIENPENHLVNQVQFLVTKALSLSAEDVNLRNYIYSELMGLESHAILVSELAHKYPALAQSLEDKLGELIVQYNLTHLVSDPENNLLNQLDDLIIVNGMMFKVQLHLFRKSFEKRIQSDSPIFAIGESVNYNDEIIAYSQDDTTSFFFLSEAMADTISSPLFIVGINGGDSILQPYGSSYNETAPSLNDRNIVKLGVDEFQIKSGYHYESDNRSEIKVQALIFFPSIQGNNLYEWEGDWYKTLDVPRSKINNSTLFTINRHAMDLSSNDYFSGKSMFLVAYERDWYVFSNTETLLNPCSNQFNEMYGLQMKYPWEYYFAECGVISSTWPAINSSVSISNQKCYFKIYRDL